MRHAFSSFATAAVIATLGSAAHASLLLVNPGFEADGGIGNNSFANNGNNPTGWDFTFDVAPGGFAGWNTFTDPDEPSNQEGVESMRLNNVTFTTEAIARATVTAGLPYELTALTGEWSGADSFQQVLAIDWFDAGGTLLSSSDVVFTAIDRAEDAPLAIESVVGIAPTGAVAAGARISTEGDWAVWDEVSLTIVPEPASLSLLAIGAAVMGLRRRSA